MSNVISLTTDFGLTSTYVAQMKAVILRVAPHASIVDVTHAIGPQDIRQGSLALAEASVHFPPQSIHIAVVDPGVGTSRRVIYVEAGDQRYVLPDNGIITEVARESTPTRVIELNRREYWNEVVSNTFHGRDIMAPVAGHLLCGVTPEQLGDVSTAHESLDSLLNELRPNGAHVQVMTIDSFGNVITTLRPDQLPAEIQVVRIRTESNSRIMKAKRVLRYADADSGGLVILSGSGGYVEIAQVNSNAARSLELQAGDKIDLEWGDADDLESSRNEG